MPTEPEVRAFPLLMTATVAPPSGEPHLARADPGVRLDDYEAALRFYLTLADDVVDRIVFVDNSASDLARLQDVVHAAGGAKDVELLSYWGLDYPVERGRVVGETLLIDHALRSSRILASLADDELFWKVTGRLRVTNLARLVRSTPHGCDLYVDFKRYRRPWLNIRLFAMTPRGFRDLLLPRLDTMGFDVLPPHMAAPEERLFGELVGELPGERIVPRLRVEPAVHGWSAVGENYRGPKRRIESAVRTVTRRVAPGLWI